MTEYERIMDELSIYYTEEEARRWLELPHPQLGGESARVVMDRREFNRVWQILDRMASGAFL